MMSKKFFKLLTTLCLATACLFLSQSAFAQTRVRASGTVTDASGEPVIGVGIFEKGTTNGAASDADGKWTLDVPAGSTLVFQSIGYNSQELPVTASRTVYDVVLTEDTTMLEDVVVVGFGTQKKVNLTGSVAVATSEDIDSRPVVDVPSALQGLLPGLQLTHSSGDFTTNMTVRVRGNGTIGSGSSDSPLILIDGMEGDINTLNPQDVDNISVLKDAASASIYGSRAAFGVVLITTKRGKEGKARITYNDSFRISSPIILPRQMDSYTFAVFFNDAARNAGNNPVFSEDTMRRMLDFQAAGGTSTGGILPSADGKYWGKPTYDPYTTGFANTDWYGELYKDHSFSQEHNLSVSGGTRDIRYYASLGYMDADGLIAYGNDHRQRFNVSANFSAQITKWANFSYNTRYIRNSVNLPSQYINGMYNELGRQCWPNLPIYDENGFFSGNGSGGSLAQKLAESGYNNTVNNMHAQQAALTLEPIKNWVTHVEFNFRNRVSNGEVLSLPMREHDTAGELIPLSKTASNYLENNQSRTEHYNWNIYSDYTFSLQDKHNFKALVGFQSDEEMIKYFRARRNGLQDVNLPVLNLTTGLNNGGTAISPTINGTTDGWSTAGFFGRVNYDYQGRYLVEANLRYDGTSRFRQNRRWTWSPSVSLGWNVAQEPFWQEFKSTVNMLKVRLSYGTLSNQNTSGYYPTYRTMNLGTANGNWIYNGERPNTANVGDLISSSLTWEKVITYNAGLDWGAFNNRFTGSFEVFRRDTKDMVGPSLTLPVTLGLSAPRSNNSDLKTVGWELNFSWRDRLQSGFGYSVAGNISDSKTIITRYPGNTTHSINTFNEGHEMGEIWGFETVGIAKTQAEMDAHLDKVGGQSSLGSMWAAGDIMYADLDGKPGITRGAETLEDHGDLKVIGNNNSHYFFGLNLAADYKGFDIRVLFQGVLKHDVWLGNEQFWGATGNMWWSCGFYDHVDYFRAEPSGLAGHELGVNLDSYYPRAIFSGKNQQVQTRYLQNAAYIRLKNLQFGYTLPQSLTGKIGLSRARVFVSGENLWTGSKLMRLFDPETVSGGRSGNAYPLSRTWSFGLSLTF
ncbi:MAG: TonB-dependent receptor [Bacteroidales bacterium]|nr:TonB-dependent receptor [Bacteroidales bacterium]